MCEINGSNKKKVDQKALSQVVVCNESETSSKAAKLNTRKVLNEYEYCEFNG